ncbi:MAG: glycoside hydrolase family 2 [Chloroflexi bacterium AL-W]|nr:glycoside hydrolase family 2 [Chloroflexi bacterium AL-N1]NOK68696.1 glycoside hydrolase family 2 [Chloroflexi bacterium AL-N10]NOK76182.1 glycoside hydrolase family 2 [Chloroflexi bacterium AL-N5]NOK84181.1 glycoside hydrolase family 2 [Chloroflexi bacterium AL-W]NOK91320.1 glycoside hydrolase family 2 [Chloroflexi bacterium AL-N15]
MQNQLRAALVLGPDNGSLSPSLEFRSTPQVGGGDVPVAWQSGLPVLSFDPQDRPHLDLAGTWKKERVTVDTNLSLTSRGFDGLRQIEQEGADRHTTAFDDQMWFDKELSNVEHEMPAVIGSLGGPEPYEGGVWYRRQFTVDANWRAQQVILHFLVSNCVLDVWVNGVWAGYHEGGYPPFALDVTELVHYDGENVVVVRVDNPPWDTRLDTVLAVKSDWWNYTGIIQDIYLEATPKLYVVRADICTPDTSRAVQVSAVLLNAPTGRTTFCGAWH